MCIVLTKATKEDVERYMDFMYELALDQTRSGYPLFSDGIATKEKFIDLAWKSYHGKSSELLLFVLDGRVEGWIQFFYIEQDRYLQTDGFHISRDTGEALSEFTEYCREHFSGYDLYLGFPKKNIDATAYLRGIGSEMVEEAYHDVLIFEEYKMRPEAAGLAKVTEENYSEFRKIHITDADTYWNADRIRETLSDWTIYLLRRDEETVGAVYARDGEIFGLDYRNGRYEQDVYEALVTKILNEFKRTGCENLTFFHDEASQAAALELGFRCVGEYVLYVKRI